MGPECGIDATPAAVGGKVDSARQFDYFRIKIVENICLVARLLVSKR